VLLANPKGCKSKKSSGLSAPTDGGASLDSKLENIPILELLGWNLTSDIVVVQERVRRKGCHFAPF